MTTHRYNVPIHQDASKRYASDLNDQEFTLIAPHVAQKSGSGKKRTVDIREVLNAIFYRTRTGCTDRSVLEACRRPSCHQLGCANRGDRGRVRWYAIGLAACGRTLVSTDPLEMSRRPAQEWQLGILRRSERLVIVTPWCERRGDNAGI